MVVGSPSSTVLPHRLWDLCGSTVGRPTKQREVHSVPADSIACIPTFEASIKGPVGDLFGPHSAGSACTTWYITATSC